MSDNYPVKDGAGNTVFKASKDIGDGVQADLAILSDVTGVDAIGNVGATPAPNTLLGRLKAVVTALGPLATSADIATLVALLTTQAGYLDGLEALLGTGNTAQAAILAKLSADPATATAQATASAKLDALATQTTVAAILAKLIAAPATEAKQDAIVTLLTTQAGYLDGVEGLLTSVLAKLSADPATQTTLEAVRVLLAGTLSVSSAAPSSLTGASTTISAAGSLTPAIDLAAQRLHRIVMPAAWTAAAITFQTSYDNATFNDLYDNNGEVTLSAAVVAGGRAILVDQSTFYGVRYLKIRSGTGATAVAQGADRVLVLATVAR